MEWKIGLVVAWTAFFLVHSIFASGRVKRYLQKHLIPFRYYRLWYNSISSLALLPVIVCYRMATPNEFFRPGIVHLSVGFVIILGSLWLWKKSFINYSLAEFAGTDRLGKNYQLHPRLRKGGLNQLVRHPLYSIAYLFLAGIFLCLPNDLILLSALSIFIYFPIGIHFEEKKLLAFFGDEYRQYKMNTPALFPDLKKILNSGHRGNSGE